jgi:hypothetical protein
MARPIRIEDDTHRREQRKYRDSLDRRREPEVGRADTAVTVAVYGLMREICSKDWVRGSASRDAFINRAADVLAAQGYSRERAVTVIRRRLVKPPRRFDALLGLEDDPRYEIIS